MGRADIRDFMRVPEVQVRAVCDVWEHNLERAARMTEDQPSGRAAGFTDFRRVLELKEIDVVVVATPDHWHALPTIMACEAGKDVYVEKPLSLTVEEGRKMVEAARRNQRVVQMGTQQRSGLHYQEAVRLIQDGVIGKISRVSAWNYENETPAGIGNPPDGNPPSDLDWDFYLGPAPHVPFNPNRFIYWFRWFWDYSGGKLTDWGTHHIDIIQWAMKADAPLSATAAGGKYVLNDNRETPDTLDVIYEYPGFICTYTNRVANQYAPNGRSYGIEFYGSDGTLFLDRSGYEVIPEVMLEEEAPTPPYLAQLQEEGGGGSSTEQRPLRKGRTEYIRGQGSDQHFPHVLNFLECVKTRGRPISDVEIGHRSTTTAHLGNIAFRVGRKIRWDAESERIIDDDEANRRLKANYRAPWTL